MIVPRSIWCSRFSRGKHEPVSHSHSRTDIRSSTESSLISLVPEDPEIPKKAKPAAGEATTDGVPPHVSSAVKRKRDAEEADLDTENIRKRGKVPEQPNGHKTIVLDDADGAIILD